MNLFNIESIEKNHYFRFVKFELFSLSRRNEVTLTYTNVNAYWNWLGLVPVSLQCRVSKIYYSGRKWEIKAAIVDNTLFMTDNPFLLILYLYCNANCLFIYKFTLISNIENTIYGGTKSIDTWIDNILNFSHFQHFMMWFHFNFYLSKYCHEVIVTKYLN